VVFFDDRKTILYSKQKSMLLEFPQGALFLAAFEAKEVEY
tara:strand:+ start:7624 stop:7743 length:120 start_codon:yes stop_codon:yes gene_type:complete